MLGTPGLVLHQVVRCDRSSRRCPIPSCRTRASGDIGVALVAVVTPGLKLNKEAEIQRLEVVISGARHPWLPSPVTVAAAPVTVIVVVVPLPAAAGTPV